MTGGQASGPGPAGLTLPPPPTGRAVVPRELLENVLQTLVRGGADYGDVFVEDRTARSTFLEGDRLDHASHGRQRGVGIRVVRDEVTVYASTEQLSEPDLLRTAQEAVEALHVAAPAGATVRLTPVPVPTPSTVHVPPESVSWQERVHVLDRAARAGRSADPRITRVAARLFESAHDIQVATTGGSYYAEHRCRIRLRVQATARDRSGRTAYGSWAPGGTGGFELLDQVARPEEVAAEAARQAIVLLDARAAPMGELPLVVSPGVGGVLLHEVCGHPLEADCLSRPGAAFSGMIGTRVASAGVTVVDDQIVPGGWGSAGVDDEGTPAQRTVVVDAGVLTGFLHDRMTAERLGHRCTGNGRRASFRHLPVPRMTNTFIAAGTDDPEEIVRDTPDGVYARSFSGGVADTTTGSFTFTIREGYRIRYGKLAEPLADLAIVGNGPQVLARIDRVGHDLSLAPSVCGKEGQKAMVSIGQPTVRVSAVTVGGTDGR